MNSFEARLSAALEQAQAGPDQRSVVYLAAVSGGADSMAMLAGLAALREEAGFTLRYTLHCIHVEHGIRPAEESRGDARSVEALCEKFKIPCRVVTIPEGKIAGFAGNGGPGIEGAARVFRHKALSAERRRLGADWILTGHTRDDLLETLLMRILKGSGPAGLAPMRRIRGRILRPLLDLGRQDVLKYLEEREIPYRTDSTNQDLRFLRNRVRLKLVPLLDRSFPGWRKAILTMAETQALTADFLSGEAGKRIPWVYSEVPGEEGQLKVPEEDFMKAPPVLREEAVFAALDLLKGEKAERKSRKPVPRRTTVRRAAAISKPGLAAGQQAIRDLGPVRLESRNGFVFVSKTPGKSGERGFSLLIKEPGLYTLKGSPLGKSELKIKVQAGTKTGAFYAQLPVVFRNHRWGDRINRGGHKRSISDILDTSVRSEYKGLITVCDAEGTSAFIAIGKKLTVISRDDARPGSVKTGSACFFEFGGLDV